MYAPDTSKSLSNRDISRVLGPDTKIVVYTDLGNYDSIDSLFGDKDNLVILYETEDHYGHWIAVLRYPDHFLVFDSYGVEIDKEIDWIPKDFRDRNGICFTYLAYLLYTSPDLYRIEYNEYPLQEMIPEITTCGYWVIARILFKSLSTDEFAMLFSQLDLENGKNLTPDELVVEWVNQYL